ncbi:hypothetical protein EJ076_34805 [Mesorhizobium sp. M7D.F.Ca.US.005.01.1.1]|uniref:hypothetical protein n=1 Tax=Mesorhizobium sp. M7D.F.Ca.US.005.01.1.1 TaxID=2493678 RepID=UPI000F7606C6|nr:hypothetical protein [Mesorhizobium sp. M7D.F.Ca.US.005.01.1.1]AZO45889.1 hypothetical protein EJ076_34805 [Mesorhizobium sp. M7D.F.Ca.US.005.01.1.1]
MPNDTPEGIGGSLSLSEAAAAYATPVKEEEAPEGQSESEQPAEDDAPLATDETDGEEGADEDEGQAGEEEQEAAPETPAYVAPEAKVKLPDGSEATVEELIKGNLRDRDYRQKTMATAELERSYKAKASEIQQFEQQLAGDRDFMVQLMQSIMPQKPDYSMVSVDPIGYAEQKAQYEARKEQLDYLVGSQQQLSQRRQQEQAETVKEIRAREWQATLDHLPELKDATRLNSFVGEIQKVAADYGYSPQEIQNVGLDHRQVRVLADAIKWRNLQASKSKVAAKVEGRPPVQRGGTRPTPEATRSRDTRAAMDRLKSSGSIRDGVAALLALEKG